MGETLLCSFFLPIFRLHSARACVCRIVLGFFFCFPASVPIRNCILMGLVVWSQCRLYGKWLCVQAGGRGNFADALSFLFLFRYFVPRFVLILFDRLYCLPNSNSVYVFLMRCIIMRLCSWRHSCNASTTLISFVRQPRTKQRSIAQSNRIQKKRLHRHFWCTNARARSRHKRKILIRYNIANIKSLVRARKCCIENHSEGAKSAKAI